jgi:hypothetical protein
MKAKIKILSVLLIGILAFVISGCGGGGKGGGTTGGGGGTTTPGTIKGVFKDEIAGDSSGITVTLETTTAGKTRTTEEVLARLSEGKLKTENISNIKLKTVAQTTTDKDGNYTFLNVEPGEYTIVANKGDQSAVITDVKVKAGEVKQLPPWAIKTKGKIQGRAKFSDKATHSGILVYIAGTSFLAMTDTAGNFTIFEVPPGNYILIAQATGYSNGYAFGVDVKPGGVANASEIILNPGTTGNHPPVISDISANPSEINVGQTSTITVTASDPDNDSLTYTYNASGGTITENGSQATFTSYNWGVYTIKVVVKDTKGASTYGSIVLFVKKEEILPLLFDKTEINPQKVSPGGEVTIKLSMEGGVPPYSYETSGVFGVKTGSVTSSEDEIILTGTAPQTEGIYAAYITVRDSLGMSEDAVFNILVEQTTTPIITGTNIYYPKMEYSNLQGCIFADGQGNCTTPISNGIINLYDEIGVLKITEQYPIYKVEIKGSGCELPVTLTCNGITKSVSVSHDVEPYGEEVITFDISPAKEVKIYTSVHSWEQNHGFRINYVKVYYSSQ